MKLDRLGKKLRREIVANPRKAAILGVMAAVALYFWAPIARGWMSRNEAVTKCDMVPVAAAQTPITSTTPPIAACETKSHQPSWQQIVTWMRNDPRTSTAPPLDKKRDPFQPAASETAKTKREEKPAQAPPSITPAAAGLVLTGTIIGPHRRLAQVNGKTYRVGQTIETLKDKQPVRADFRLLEVQPRRVVLESGGQRFELTAAEPGKSANIEF